MRVVELGAVGVGAGEVFISALGHVHRAPVIHTFGAGFTDEVVHPVLEVVGVDVAIDDGQVGHFFKTGQVAEYRFLGGVDVDLVLVEVVLQLLEIGRFAQAQRGVDVHLGVILQLLVGGPDGVLAVDLAPLGYQVFFHDPVFVARLHAHQRTVDVLLQAGDGRRHGAGGHVLGDLDIEQLVLIEVIGGLDFVVEPGADEFLGVGHHLVEVVGHQGVAQGFVELGIDGLGHGCSLQK
nr:hypothetical protein [Pseudomonas sp. Irchel 3E20]